MSITIKPNRAAQIRQLKERQPYPTETDLAALTGSLPWRTELASTISGRATSRRRSSARCNRLPSSRMEGRWLSCCLAECRVNFVGGSPIDQHVVGIGLRRTAGLHVAGKGNLVAVRHCGRRVGENAAVSLYDHSRQGRVVHLFRRRGKSRLRQSSRRRAGRKADQRTAKHCRGATGAVHVADARASRLAA